MPNIRVFQQNTPFQVEMFMVRHLSLSAQTFKQTAANDCFLPNHQFSDACIWQQLCCNGQQTEGG